MQGHDQAAGDGRAFIRAHDLACRRGGRLLFTGLSFDLSPGQSLLVAGPNGVGKSSLLRLIAGLLAPFEGAVETRGAVTLADERLALDPDRPLAEALAFWARIDGRADALPAAMAAMDLATLAEVPVRILSTGQRKRAVLARALASGAPIWLLDEPGNGLDSAAFDQLGEAVTAHLAAGGIVVAASHQPLPWEPTEVVRIARPLAAEDMT